MPANHTDLEKRLWDAADELRANSKLKTSEYSVPVLGMIFLRYADHRFAEAEKLLAKKSSGRRRTGKTDYQARGVLYLPDKARFGSLLRLPEGANIGRKINEAMKAIEADNANYLWIQIFYSALNKTGRAGFVMANSASDARGSELEIRRKLIEDRAVDVMVSVGPNFFYTVTLPCTLWFLDRGKKKTDRKDKVLFIDARQVFRRLDRAHRDFRPEQIEFLANIVRLYRGEKPEFNRGSKDLMKEKFPKGKYQDVAGLCKVATVKQIEAQGWSLNPGRYVGVADRPKEDFDFAERLQEMTEELEILNLQARKLEERIGDNVARLQEGTPA